MRLIIQEDDARVAEWVASYVVKRINDYKPTAERPFVLGEPRRAAPHRTARSFARKHPAPLQSPPKHRQGDEFVFPIVRAASGMYSLYILNFVWWWGGGRRSRWAARLWSACRLRPGVLTLYVIVSMGCGGCVVRVCWCAPPSLSLYVMEAGLPTGSSPVKTYKKIVELHKAGKISFEHVVTLYDDLRRAACCRPRCGRRLTIALN